MPTPSGTSSASMLIRIGSRGSRLALTQAGRVHASYGKPGLLGFGGVAAVAVGAVLVSYMAVQSY